MKNITITAAAALMGVTLFASNLNRQAPVEAPAEVRNQFIDFSTGNTNADISYTIGIQVSAVRPTLDTSLGFQSFEATEENLFVKGPSIQFMDEILPAVSGHITFSDTNSATLLTISLDHYNKFGQDTPLIAEETSQFFLTNSFHGQTEPIGYCRIDGVFNNQRTALKAAIGGYSLQYKNFALSSLFGIVGSHTALATEVNAIQLGKEAEIDTFGGIQTSLSGGLYCSFAPSLVIFDSEQSAVYFSAEIGFTGESSANSGSVYHYRANTETETKSLTSNTAIDPHSLTSSIEKKLALSLVSKPQDGDMSFFTLQFGIGQNKEMGRNMISKAQSGTATDITTSFAYLSLAYTM
ncbi:hypothetical protein K0U07_02205 [bacterium]|nr:hypothetical protein [bacterium]